jgi:DNA replication and repair protein RecF
MQLAELRIENLRNVASAQIELSPRVNLLLGGNGAGKTSVLEAAYLLSHGRSFRAGKQETLTRIGQDALSIFGRVAQAGGAERRVGMVRSKTGWEARLDGRTPDGMIDVLREVAVVCFEPGSHDLIAGPGEGRRRFLDWGVFHVEPEFGTTARRFRRALKQRNALLRVGASASEFGPWNAELDSCAERVDRWRRHYLDRWRVQLATVLDRLLPELGVVSVSYRRGWTADATLMDVLTERLDRDRARGHTGAGPHRADWGIAFEKAPLREHLSRGQEKLCALACSLSQAVLFAELRGEWPVVCLDDLASELDRDHQAAVLDWLATVEAQVLITGTERPATLSNPDSSTHTFHVEQGQVTRLL